MIDNRLSSEDKLPKLELICHLSESSKTLKEPCKGKPWMLSNMLRKEEKLGSSKVNYKETTLQKY
jgi:hypothetical protein